MPSQENHESSGLLTIFALAELFSAVNRHHCFYKGLRVVQAGLIGCNVKHGKQCAAHDERNTLQKRQAFFAKFGDVIENCISDR